MPNVFSAVERGDTQELSRLLNAGADPNEIDAFGDTPLIAALRNQTLWTIEVLIAHGADPDHASSGHPSARDLAPLFSYQFGDNRTAA